MDSNSPVKVIGTIADRDDMFRQMCACLGIPPETMRELRRCLPDLIACAPKLTACTPTLQKIEGCVTTIAQVPEMCTRLDEVVSRCDKFTNILKNAGCPGQKKYGNVTLSRYSSITTVDIDQIKTGLGDPYVDTFPVATTKKIRLDQLARPGYIPEEIEINLVLANDGTNYLNANIQFFVGDSKVGPNYKGSAFLDADGRTKKIKFPHFDGEPVEIGSDDVLSVEIAMSGPNALTFATVVIHVDAQGWYNACS